MERRVGCFVGNFVGYFVGRRRIAMALSVVLTVVASILQMLCEECGPIATPEPREVRICLHALTCNAS